MAALAYLLPPLSGLFAYLKGHNERVRLHGLQSVALGVVWPAALFACTRISTVATQVAWVVGGLVWLGLLAATAAGRDPVVPPWRELLARAAAEPPSRA